MGVDTKWLAKHFEEQEARMSDALVKRGYADGKYVCSCRKCEGTFMGDKRAWCCKGCAMSSARIEALIAERDEAWRRAAHAEEMWGETEVKLSESEALLAKAVEVAEKSIKWLRLYGAGVHCEAVALKKLTGGKDE